MISLIRFIGLIILLLSCTPLQAQESTYFRHLVFRESPISYQRGIHQIDAEEAKTTAHFRFDYNSQGKVIEISHRIGEDLIAPNGNWDSFTWFAPKMTINYEEGKEIVRYYDEFNEAYGAHGGIYSSEYSLAPSGKRIALHHFGKNHERVQGNWNVHRYEWNHVKEGSIIERRFDLEDKPTTLRPVLTFYTVKLEYGDDDLLDFMYHINEEGDLIDNSMGAAIDRIVYDLEGNFIRWMVFDKDRNLFEGNRPKVALGEHLYDSKGNKIGMRGYDIYMQAKTFSGGFAQNLNEYDSYGNMISEKYVDMQGKLLLKTIFTYSNDGKRQEAMAFVDEENTPINHRHMGWASEVRQFDENGRIIKRNRYLADGSPFISK